ncbi:hypothetical protein EVAR_97033_1 [Eumeta japonica]|uniref:Uncharacterized protein n=1 Tax=Eumeta variegata TaxID=151549 RepID=A0A4C1WJY9_EUMVA|nr:hypothetical protein EVAR_97033_1 [Eumeta japonica]
MKVPVVNYLSLKYPNLSQETGNTGMCYHSETAYARERPARNVSHNITRNVIMWTGRIATAANSMTGYHIVRHKRERARADPLVFAVNTKAFEAVPTRT